MVSQPQLAIEVFPGSVSVVIKLPPLLCLPYTSKTLYYDVTPFLYYVMVRCTILGLQRARS